MITRHKHEIFYTPEETDAIFQRRARKRASSRITRGYPHSAFPYDDAASADERDRAESIKEVQDALWKDDLWQAYQRKVKEDMANGRPVYDRYGRESRMGDQANQGRTQGV